MSNAEIFGYREEVHPTDENGLACVWKYHFRDVTDAAIPPGQSVGFEFYVAKFPFMIAISFQDDYIGTLTDNAKYFDRSVTFNDSSALRRTEIVSRLASFGAGADPQWDASITSLALRNRPGSHRIGEGVFEPPTPEPPTPDPPLDTVVPFEVTLTPPNGLAPLVFTNPKRSEIERWPKDTARIDPAYMERGKGLWAISVRNIEAPAKRPQIQVQAVHAVTSVSQRDVPLSILNGLSETAMRRAAPTIEYEDGKLIVSTPTYFLDLFDVERSFELGVLFEKGVRALPTFRPLRARVMSTPRFIALIEARKALIQAELDALLENMRREPLSLMFQTNDQLEKASSFVGGRQKDAIAACDKSLARLRSLSSARSAFCLVLEGLFTDPTVELEFVGSIAEIDNAIPQVGLVFDTKFELTDVVSNLAISLSPALAKVVYATAGAIGAMGVLTGPIGSLVALVAGAALYTSIDDIALEDMLREQIRSKKKEIKSYVKRTLERVIDLGAFAFDCSIVPGGAADGEDALRIRYVSLSKAHPPRPRLYDRNRGSSFEEMSLEGGEYNPRTARGIIPAQPSAAVSVVWNGGVNRETAGPLPSDLDFAVPDQHTLARLDDHDCIVVIMMENRSYDHFFHDLPLAYPNKGYSSPPQGYHNVAPPGFGQPMFPVHNRSIGIGNSLLFAPRVPELRHLDLGHNYTATRFQMGGGSKETESSGEMKAFARHLAGSSNSPQIAMTYFGMDDLPVYKALAKHYPICDRWFSALPLGTQPNRLAAFQGNVPFLFNIDPGDPSAGYLEDYSIFDVFDSQQISWMFFESDIGTIRMYDRYRLNVGNVRPVQYLDGTLRAAAEFGLPRAIFIEPHFFFGNDDHPPMDVSQGQKFIQWVIGKFIEYGLMDNTLFVITYDEHGGFFDHVPPPGTPASDTFGDSAIKKYGSVEPLFVPSSQDVPPCTDPADSKPPTSLGVRVPSLVLSKYASARANHTILDHTSILKTLLLHNRERISTAQFGRFGDRIKKRGHIGQVLDREVPRVIDYDALRREIGYQTGSSWLSGFQSTLVSSRVAGLSPSHPAAVLRGIGMPRGRIMKG